MPVCLATQTQNKNSHFVGCRRAVFFADAVTGKEQPFAWHIPNGECEHAAKVFHTGCVPLLVGRKNDLSIGLRMEVVTQSFEFLAQRLKIVDLAVEYDLGVAGRTCHGLMAAPV